MATGFALLLAAAISIRDQAGWRRGLLWGAAGYGVFFLAPALGLPPELPGTQSAPLFDRQLWWAGTAASSAIGLWLAAFARHGALRVLGLALIAAPQVVGAPQPLSHGATAPDELARDFLRASYFVNAIFWLALGALVGYAYSRLAAPLAR